MLTQDHIRAHTDQGLPLVPLFNIDVIEADQFPPPGSASATACTGLRHCARAAACFTAEVRITEESRSLIAYATTTYALSQP